MKCTSCGKRIPKARLEALPETTLCVQCAERSGAAPVGFMVYGHKTAPELVIVDKRNEEALRQARRANRRSR